MICYFPFTHIPRRHLRTLFSRIGVFTVVEMDQSLVPDHMRQAAREGFIDLRPCDALAPGRLLPAIQAYKQWAELHQGNLADMAGFFRSVQAGFPMMDETNPSQISTQIRKFGDTGAGWGQDPVLQAALFLSMAQAYDMQQEDLRKDLGTVHSMEQKMLHRLAGDGRTGADAIPDHTASRPAADPEPGGYMTAARVEAWARLARGDDNPAVIYLTTSPAVMDHLLNLFAHGEKPVRLVFADDGADPGPQVAARRATLKDLTRSAAPLPEALEGFQPADDGASAGLTLVKLPGITPGALLKGLSASASDSRSAAAHEAGREHVLIGLVDFG